MAIWDEPVRKKRKARKKRKSKLKFIKMTTPIYMTKEGKGKFNPYLYIKEDKKMKKLAEFI